MTGRPPRPGELRTRVRLQRLTSEGSTFSRDAFGEVTNQFADVQTVWAKLEATAARESVMADQVQAEVTLTLWIRYHSGVASLNSRWRGVTSDNRVLLFDGATRRQENNVSWWQIECRESPDTTIDTTSNPGGGGGFSQLDIIEI